MDDTEKYLKLTGCKTSEPLFDLIRLIRNTIHTNGIYRPHKSVDKTIVYGGRSFFFEVGKQLTWMGDELPAWLADYRP